MIEGVATIKNFFISPRLEKDMTTNNSKSQVKSKLLRLHTPPMKKVLKILTLAC